MKTKISYLSTKLGKLKKNYIVVVTTRNIKKSETLQLCNYWNSITNGKEVSIADDLIKIKMEIKKYL